MKQLISQINLSLRKANIFTDFKKIRELRKKSSETSRSHYSVEDVKIMTGAGDHLLLDFINPFRKIYVGTLEKQIVGYIEIAPSKEWLWHIFVHPSYAGKGIGKFLMNKVEEMFKQEDLENIKLYARLNAVNFYKKLGFVEKGRHNWKNIFTRYKSFEMKYMVKKI
ncbi:MAG: GNAT family N-acetyltransferase [Nanoarchaeota archaeon]|nr:GNAT family N-acetyltransferase [Nanoarchaeota archaeon]